ncbi:hypothetical protein RIF29_30843 [Crotalaria pallida]|uniref:NAC domain-containing protein n=1 Tax=Crotalaria pallida TaxID=3830 RepID=A0AAN9EH16_CROPI
MEGANDHALFPLGCTFSPIDEDLVNIYLMKKVFGQAQLNIIPHGDVFQSDPSLLPGGTLQTKTKWVMHEFRLARHETPDLLQVADWAVYRLFEDKSKSEEGSDEKSSKKNNDDAP